MEFFLYEIVARIVAIYFGVECGRRLWSDLVERKTRPFSPDFLHWLDPWSNWIARNDADRIRHWIRIGGEIFLLVACLIVAIFGWWRPNT